VATDPATSIPSVPRGSIFAVGVFLVFGTLAATYAGLTLVFPGTILDRGWALNPKAHQQMLSMGRAMGIPFFLLAVALGLAAVGWFGDRLWAWRLTVSIIAVQLLGDLVNLTRGEFLAGSFGVLIASALLFYLFRRPIRSHFDGR